MSLTSIGLLILGFGVTWWALRRLKAYALWLLDNDEDEQS